MNKIGKRFLVAVAGSGDPVLQMEAISGITSSWEQVQAHVVGDDDPEKTRSSKLAIEHIGIVPGKTE